MWSLISNILVINLVSKIYSLILCYVTVVNVTDLLDAKLINVTVLFDVKVVNVIALYDVKTVNIKYLYNIKITIATVLSYYSCYYCIMRNCHKHSF